MSDSVWPHRQQFTRLLCPWDSPGKNTRVGCHFLLHFITASWLFFYISKNLFLIEGQLPYNIVLVSAIHQYESTIDVHMPPPSWIFLPSSSWSQSPGLSSLHHTANPHWLSSLHMVIYTFPCRSLHPSHPLLPLHPPCPQVHSLCVSTDS